MRAAFLLLFVAGCGYGATPVGLEVQATDPLFATSTFTTRGLLDPGASGRNDGLVISSRWEIATSDATTFDLVADFDRSALPSEVTVDKPRQILLGEALSIVTRERDREGAVVREVAASAGNVTIDALTDDGPRQLASGLLTLELPVGGAYSKLVIAFETLPSPVGTALPTGGDAETGGDPGAGRPADQNTGGCSCGGSDDTGDTEPPPEEKSPEDNGGCACTSDDGSDEENTDDSTSADSGGCACTGDDGSEEQQTADTTSTSSDGGGCDCAGDDSSSPSSGDTDTSSSSGDADSGAGGCDCAGPTTSDDGGAPQSAQVIKTRALRRRHHHTRCEARPVKVGFELSPLVFAWVVSRRRRAPTRERR